MAQAVLPVLVLLAIVIVGVVLFTRFAVGMQGRSRAIEESDAPTLRHEVANGQDVAVVLHALRRAGYDAASDPETPRQVVVIACPDGVEAERERVRTTIANAANAEGDVMGGGPVRFSDEES